MLRALGASVRGPAHTAEGLANQDAWSARVGARGALAVVCDGMGSKPHARLGAISAVTAARSAFGHWVRASNGRPEDLARLTEVLWRLRLGETPPEQAATTCLLGALRPDGSGAALQLGDGLIGVLRPDNSFTVLTPERTTFGSLSVGLGVRHGLTDWGLHTVTPLPPGGALILASDGVADDLQPKRWADFVTWLVSDVACDPAPVRRLQRELRAWPVPHHRDDKTVVVLWNTPDQ